MTTHTVRCACGSYSTWERPIFGEGGTPSKPLVWQGCGNPSHHGQALGAPVSPAEYRRLMAAARANRGET
jgi:hypothetical protein